ncbi:MAG: OmpH family outer membrane protein [Flammeovirgaceae bacterium]
MNIRYFFILIISLSITFATKAQNFGYIDSQVIIEKLPEYKEAQEQIEKLTQTWLGEIEQMRKSLDSLRNDYRAEEILLTQEMKQERLKVIEAKEKDLRDFQNKAFGYEGLLFLKRQELIKPLQDKIAEACEKVARKKKLAFLFDKSGDLVMIYTDPRHNYTEYVLEELDLGDPADTPR